jgi:ABC-type nitrate/sulfonate/bicarbonate transport system permease component
VERCIGNGKGTLPMATRHLPLVIRNARTGGQPSIARRREGEDKPLVVWGLRLGSLVAIAAMWQVWAGAQESLLIPDFVGTVGAILDLAISGTIWGPLLVSNQAMMLGFLAAAATAMPLGLLMARVRLAESFVDVYLNILMVTPMAALIPIFLMAMGLDISARAAVVYVFAAPVMTVNTRAGVRSIDPSLVEMARTYCASELQVWRKVLLPGALPAMMTGVRLGLSRAINGMLLAEMLLMAVGVGKLILDYRAHFEADHLFAVVIILLVESIVLLVIARWAESRATPWALAGGSR